ncbi:putative Fe-Mo cluster-binding NifX family protein [Youngiibacter multivorans]|uniref:Fe-Mo cluster-binding NifX family protein n=2 Tax=Youngiibacter multivorans TaxID=937251 RepID=A0ABS4G079_9CLOT|nr:NifB/NifX family molybdenum-iron cluster-binding protein [Youngiibacter multivorans]MBP1917955.1 putative Fe-Mo cluster-binding NifX family protein [Youngiibacter multivorans]
MKIAVACDGGLVTEHFGHCEAFDIYTEEIGSIVRHERVQNPGHTTGFLPVYLKEMGAEVIISGGMGGSAVRLFNEKEIEVVTGARGDSRFAAESYLRGELVSTGSICHEHMHHGEC